MEKLTWFKFSPINWLMGKIQRVPETTQMRFIKLICLYWNKECVLSVEDAEMEIDKKHLDLLINKKIVKVNEDCIVIDFINEQYDEIKEKSRKNTENVQKRWAKNKPNPTTEIPKDTTVLPNDTDKRREEEIREDNINLTVNWHALLEQFNSITGKRLKVVNDKVKRQVRARLKEGYSKEDIVNAVINCFNDAYHKEHGHKYLTLEFITRADKLEKYSNVDPNFKTAPKQDRL